MEISWGTIKSLLFTLGPLLLPKAISYYRQARTAPRAAGLSIVPLPAAARRSIAILLCAALLFLVLSLPTFAPENVFVLTQSRLQIPTDVLFTRLSALRPFNALTKADDALRARFVNLESRLLYLQYGPAALAECPFCGPDEPTAYFWYALPALLAPHLLNLALASLATTSGGLLTAPPSAARWRWLAAVSAVLLAGFDAYRTYGYNAGANARATRLSEIDAFFWRGRAQRHLSLAALDGLLAAFVYLSSTNRAFARGPSPAERVEGAARLLAAVKARLSVVGVVRNTAVRDEGLRRRAAEYWAREGAVVRAAMEEREVVEGVNDALANRIRIQEIERDADAYVEAMLPRAEVAGVGGEAGGTGTGAVGEGRGYETDGLAR
ncbi:hypothetical protein DL770_001493 [Monosporascus sp. CRB-9-2]|nr:hypothetical protein DL770_001493 [Monosporascus sp. CRB-9-2]